MTVTVDDAHLPSIRAVAAALTDRGMHVDGVRPIVGVITGACSEEELPGLEAVQGVVAVERARGFTATAPDDESTTTTSRPDPPPGPPATGTGDGPVLEREPDGRYRVVDTPPPSEDEGRH
ncbi:hypothetical protein [Actinomycetospora termitidis]|uniref:Ketohydroxyglutarate aldolase n=1 Tax=Actinomycetospora termitidis TaxID=3053470 RepID=A0ABT7MGH4_9PSEU|nr:hypothetical protein [Actinomycetospora sp. Odt1-22]MDL5159042.1 hypothetical protein [Actinomycetospora sp. Odt1-22]